MRVVGPATGALVLACAGVGRRPADAVVQFGTERDDMAWTVTAWDGAIYAAGSTDHVFDKVCDTDTLDEQAYVQRFDAATLAPAWNTPFGTRAGDTVRAIEADGTGIFVVGTTGGALDGPFGGGRRDVFVRRLSHDGRVVAGRQIGTSGTDEGLSLALHGGWVWIAGGTTGDLCATFPSHRKACASGREDAFVARLDRDLNVIAVAQVGSDRFEEATGIAVDDQWVVLAGGTGGRIGDREHGKGDAWVARLTHGLELRDVHQFGSDQSDFARDVAMWNGDVFVVGRTEGAVPPDNDAYLYRVPFDGKAPWIRTWGDASGGTASRVVADATGVYTAGSSGMGFVKHGCEPVDQRSEIRRFTHAGDLVWEVVIDSPGVEDEVMGLAVSGDGVFATGKTLGTLGERRLGAYDAWVARLPAGGPAPR